MNDWPSWITETNYAMAYTIGRISGVMKVYKSHAHPGDVNRKRYLEQIQQALDDYEGFLKGKKENND